MSHRAVLSKQLETELCHGSFHGFRRCAQIRVLCHADAPSSTRLRQHPSHDRVSRRWPRRSILISIATYGRFNMHEHEILTQSLHSENANRERAITFSCRFQLHEGSLCGEVCGRYRPGNPLITLDIGYEERHNREQQSYDEETQGAGYWPFSNRQC